MANLTSFEIKTELLREAEVAQEAGNADLASFLKSLADNADMNSKVFGSNISVDTWRTIFESILLFESEWRPADVFTDGQNIVQKILL